MLKPICIFALMVVVISAKKDYPCNNDFDYTHPIYDDVIVRNLKITQLGLPGRYNERFVDNIQTFIGSFSVSLQRMREQNVDQIYIKRMKSYQTGFVKQVNAFGSLSDRSRFVTTVTRYSSYLTTEIENVQQYIQTVKDTYVQYYFYNIMLNMISSRSFYTYALETSRCIYINEASEEGSNELQGGKSNESNEDSGESKEKGGKSKEKGGKSKEKGGKSKEKGGKSKEKGGKSKEKGGKSKEKDGKGKGKGGKSKEKGGKSKEKKG